MSVLVLSFDLVRLPQVRQKFIKFVRGLCRNSGQDISQISPGFHAMAFAGLKEAVKTNRGGGSTDSIVALKGPHH